MTTGLGSRAKRRDDIQGLRAISALLVLVFHIWVGRVSGGVDVFFVISGYLLLGSMTRKMESRKSLAVLPFTANLLRRLLPQALFVIVVVAASLPLWLPETRLEATLQDLIASTAYVENWHLRANSVDYLRRDEVASPLQHYWAMSLQVQALILYAFAFAGAAWAARRFGWRGDRVALGLLSGAALLGFALAVWRTGQNQSEAYFETPARLWEFALGGLAAYAAARVQLPKILSFLAGWLGLAAIVGCGALLDVSRYFPGWAALIPTLGAVGVLVAGTSPHRFGVQRLLTLRPLQFIGDRSYALYLWHWPMLVAWLTLHQVTMAGPWSGLLIALAAMLFAYLSTRFVEKPVRDRGSTHKPGLRSLAASFAAVLFLWGGLNLGEIAIARNIQQALDAPLDVREHPGALAFGKARRFDEPVRPSPLVARHDRAQTYDDGCHQTLEGVEPISCSFGAGDPDAPIVAIVGSSHAAQWLPAVLDIAREHGWRVVNMTKSGCNLGGGNGMARYEAACAEWIERALGEMERLSPDVVLTTATRGRTLDVPEGYAATWRRLNAAGIGVLAIRDTPWLGFDVAECVERHGADSPRCARPRARLLDSGRMTLPSGVTRVRMVDYSNFFCTPTLCPPVAGNVMIYFDWNHVSGSYMHTLAPILARQLVPAVAAWRHPRPAIEDPLQYEVLVNEADENAIW